MGYFRKLPDAPKILSESVTRLELVTGSRIVSLPGTEGTIRGYAAASLIVVDEAARVTDELMVACRPMLATSGGRLVAVSTPAPGRSGWFFHAWHGPENWNRVRVPADQCPRISKEFLDEEMRVLGPLQFGQEYMLEWQDNEEGVFALEMFDRCASDQVEWLTCLT
jgi:hypothetical protein